MKDFGRQASVRFENVEKSFGDVKVLRDFDLEVQPGEFVVLLGASGSGKTTLSRHLAQVHRLAHLDLDSLAWIPSSDPPQRAPLDESARRIHAFIAEHDGWIIEGCYTDLLEIAASSADEIIFLNLSIEACIDNARQRPWEPHKYESPQAQDANLDMLIDWISQYATRDDTFSYQCHQQFFEQFPRQKTMISHQPDLR